MSKKQVNPPIGEHIREEAKRFETDEGRIWFSRLLVFMKGNDGTHTVSFEHNRWHCDCDFFQTRGVCSHTMALERILQGMLPGYAETDSKAVLDSLTSSGVLIPEPGEITDYLLHYPDMADILLPVCHKTKKRFGASAELSLEVYHDPEITDEHLVLYVREANYDRRMLDTIEEVWADYEDELAAKSGWLLVTTDFRPPR